MSTRALDPEEARIHGIAVATKKALSAEDKRLRPDLSIATSAQLAKDAEQARLAAGAQ
jgi:hypothetical protein